MNKYPDFVVYAVKRLKTLFPMLGTKRIANVLCRAGLHLGATTVRRMLKDGKKPFPPKTTTGTRHAERVVTSRSPGHVWHADLTTVPTSLVFWAPWLPFSFAPIWPFCWFVAIVEDHFSRRIMGVAVFRKEPSSKAIRAFLDRAIRAAVAAPKHLISDQGSQFIDEGLDRWCRRRGIKHRFGAIGKYGSIAVIERLMRTLKSEGTRRLLFIPFRRTVFNHELVIWIGWYNGHRPHETLEGETPDEVYFHRRPACRAPRFEPRAQWPRSAPCAGPHALVRRRPGVRVELRRALRGRPEALAARRSSQSRVEAHVRSVSKSRSHGGAVPVKQAR